MPTIFLWTVHYNMFWHVIAFLVQCKIEFYFTHEPQNLYFHWWFPPLVKILHLVCIRWNKIQSDCEKIKISSTYYGISRACVNETILMTALQKKKKTKKKNVETPKIRDETSQVLLAGGQVVLLGNLPFSAHLMIDSAQNEWNNFDPNKTQIKKCSWANLDLRSG